MIRRGRDIGRRPGGHPEGNLLGGEIEILQASEAESSLTRRSPVTGQLFFRGAELAAPAGAFRIAEDWDGVEGVPLGWLEWATYS